MTLLQTRVPETVAEAFEIVARKKNKSADALLAELVEQSTHTKDAEGWETQTDSLKGKPRLSFAFLHWPEMSKAIFGFVADAETVWNDVNADLLGGVRLYRPGEDCERVARRAAGLMRHYCKRWPSLRSLDVLHVATAIELGSKTLLSFDSQQRVLAHVQKLEVWPELTPSEKQKL